MPSTLLSLFSQVSDPRRGQGKMYPLAPILLFTVAMLQYPSPQGHGSQPADRPSGKRAKSRQDVSNPSLVMAARRTRAVSSPARPSARNRGWGSSFRGFPKGIAGRDRLGFR